MDLIPRGEGGREMKKKKAKWNLRGNEGEEIVVCSGLEKPPSPSPTRPLPVPLSPLCPLHPKILILIHIQNVNSGRHCPPAPRPKKGKKTISSLTYAWVLLI